MSLFFIFKRPSKPYLSTAKDPNTFPYTAAFLIAEKLVEFLLAKYPIMAPAKESPAPVGSKTFWTGKTGIKTKCNEAIYTFVAVDNMGKPSKVAEVSPETDLEKRRFEGALRRRQLSLILAGKLKADDASELKALFTQK